MGVDLQGAQWTLAIQTWIRVKQEGMGTLKMKITPGPLLL